MATGQNLQLTDDMAVGAVIGEITVYFYVQMTLFEILCSYYFTAFTEGILGYNFTNVNTIYSQLNAPGSIPPTKIKHVVHTIFYNSAIIIIL